jgi:hypothetical protein
MTEPQVGRRRHQVPVRDMVQVHRDGYQRAPGDRQCRQPDGTRILVVSDAVLADLQYYRRGRRLRARDDGLGMLEADDVEGADSATFGRRGRHDRSQPRDWHQAASIRMSCTSSSARR